MKTGIPLIVILESLVKLVETAVMKQIADTTLLAHGTTEPARQWKVIAQPMVLKMEKTLELIRRIYCIIV